MSDPAEAERAATDAGAETCRPCAIARALLAGVIGGFAAGVIDVLLVWGRTGQFLGVGGKLRLLLHAGTLYALAGALAGAAFAATLLFFRNYTALGPLVRHAAAQHAATRARDPRAALVGVSLVLAGLPAIGGALALAYRVGLTTLAHRQHKPLIMAVTVGATVAALGAAALLTFALARPLELGLRRVVRGRALRLLSAPFAPAALAAALLLVGGIVGYVIERKPLSLDQLHLRPIVVALALVGACTAAWPLALGPARRLRRLPRRAVRTGINVALPVLALLLAVLTGASDGVRKAGAQYTGLVGPLEGAARWLLDTDRDGYSPILGGGDCDDWNRGVHPGAFDLPDDGVDQNCLGGDLKLDRTPEDVHFAPLPATVPAQTNILFVTIDTVRADHVGAYGYSRPTTPTIDALAAEGGLFENAFAHAPSTRYSMPAILTGRYPSQVLWDNSMWWPGLSPDNHTIAEILHEQGFATGALLNYDYFEKKRRMDQGFDEYSNKNAALHRLTTNDPASTRGTSSKEQAEDAIAWIDAHAAKRFFLWVHFYDPHFQYERHPGTQEFGPDDGDPQALYDGEIRFTDDQLGRVIQRLRDLGLYDKTIVVVVSDHGEGFGEHGLDFHGYHLYAAQTKVPLVIRVPGLAPQRIAMPAGHVDLLPTLANLAGAAPDGTMLGRSLVDVLSGEAGDPERVVYQEVEFELGSDRRGTRRYGAVSARWHLLYELMPNVSWQLYDRERDPNEGKDVSGGADAGQLKQRLQEWIDTLQFPPGAGAMIKAALLPGAPSPQAVVSADLAGAVKLLGADLPATEVRVGQSFDATWYFQSKKRLDGDWLVFVHFEGPRGWKADHAPVGGAFPVPLWRQGQFIADRQAIAVPPGTLPGDYAVFVGLWSKQKNKNLGERVRVGTLRVVR